MFLLIFRNKRMIKPHNNDKRTDNRGEWTVNNDARYPSLILVSMPHSQVVHETLKELIKIVLIHADCLILRSICKSRYFRLHFNVIIFFRIFSILRKLLNCSIRCVREIPR